MIFVRLLCRNGWNMKLINGSIMRDRCDDPSHHEWTFYPEAMSRYIFNREWTQTLTEHASCTIVTIIKRFSASPVCKCPIRTRCGDTGPIRAVVTLWTVDLSWDWAFTRAVPTSTAVSWNWRQGKFMSRVTLLNMWLGTWCPGLHTDTEKQRICLLVVYILIIPTWFTTCLNKKKLWYWNGLFKHEHY